MSWSSAAQRTHGRRTACLTTSLVWFQTSLCSRSPSCCRCTVASSSGKSAARSPVSRIHSRAESTSRPRSRGSKAARTSAGAAAFTPAGGLLRRPGDRLRGPRPARVADRRRDIKQNQRVGLCPRRHPRPGIGVVGCAQQVLGLFRRHSGASYRGATATVKGNGTTRAPAPARRCKDVLLPRNSRSPKRRARGSASSMKSCQRVKAGETSRRHFYSFFGSTRAAAPPRSTLAPPRSRAAAASRRAGGSISQCASPSQ
jgi:hypothetical protein